MSQSKFQFERGAVGDAWDDFVQTSPQGCIFVTTAFLRSFDALFTPVYCYKGDQLVAAIIVCESHGAEATAQPPHWIYNGLLFAAPHVNQSLVQTQSEQFQIMQEAVEYLAANYNGISLTLHPSIVDIRPFLWHNYHDDGAKFKADIRYTCLLDLPQKIEPSTSSNLAQGFSKIRRWEIKKSQENGVTCKAEYDADQFLRMYELTFLRQEKQVSSQEISLITNIIKQLDLAGSLFAVTAYTQAGEAANILLFGVFNDTAYYLYGAGDPDLREHNAGSLAFMHAFSWLSEQGIKLIDFEGVNSPNRGHYKLSYGGRVVPYYRLTL